VAMSSLTLGQGQDGCFKVKGSVFVTYGRNRFDLKLKKQVASLRRILKGLEW